MGRRLVPAVTIVRLPLLRICRPGFPRRISHVKSHLLWILKCLPRTQLGRPRTVVSRLRSKLRTLKLSPTNHRYTTLLAMASTNSAFGPKCLTDLRMPFLIGFPQVLSFCFLPLPNSRNVPSIVLIDASHSLLALPFNPHCQSGDVYAFPSQHSKVCFVVLPIPFLSIVWNALSS